MIAILVASNHKILAPYTRSFAAILIAAYIALESPVAGDEMLPAIDVVRCAREGLIDHDVDGERSHVGWTDDPPDGKSGAELIAARVEIGCSQPG
jgi:hypothetical protein